MLPENRRELDGGVVLVVGESHFDGPAPACRVLPGDGLTKLGEVHGMITIDSVLDLDDTGDDHGGGPVTKEKGRTTVARPLDGVNPESWGYLTFVTRNRRLVYQSLFHWIERPSCRLTASRLKDWTTPSNTSESASVKLMAD